MNEQWTKVKRKKTQINFNKIAQPNVRRTRATSITVPIRPIRSSTKRCVESQPWMNGRNESNEGKHLIFICEFIYCAWSIIRTPAVHHRYEWAYSREPFGDRKESNHSHESEGGRKRERENRSDCKTTADEQRLASFSRKSPSFGNNSQNVRPEIGSLLRI